MFDYIIIVFYILSLVHGWREGVLKIIYKFISLLISFYLTKLLYNPVKNFFYSQGLNKWFEQSVRNLIKIEAPENLTIYEKRDLLDGLNLPDSISNYIMENNNIENYTSLGVEKFNDYIIAMISSIVCNIIIIIILFLLIFTILKSLKFILNIINNLPIVGEINKGLGAFMQCILFTIYLCIFNLVLSITISVAFFDVIRNFVQGSFFGNYELISNVILKFLLNFFS